MNQRTSIDPDLLVQFLQYAAKNPEEADSKLRRLLFNPTQLSNVFSLEEADPEDPKPVIDPTRWAFQVEVNYDLSIPELLEEANVRGPAQNDEWVHNKGFVPFHTGKRWKTLYLREFYCLVNGRESLDRLKKKGYNPVGPWELLAFVKAFRVFALQRKIHAIRDTCLNRPANSNTDVEMVPFTSSYSDKVSLMLRKFHRRFSMQGLFLCEKIDNGPSVIIPAPPAEIDIDVG